MKIYIAVASTSFTLPLIFNMCIIEYQNTYAQLGTRILFNKTNNGTNITTINYLMTRLQLMC
jgi:hypothetical protein